MDYKLKRNVLSLAKKIELLAKSSRPGVARKDLAKEFGIDVSCVCRILKNRDTLLSEWLKGGNQDRKRKRDGKDARIEDALFRWFTAARDHGIPISGPVLMEKARDLAVAMGIEFEPTSGWLSRWKKRNNIGNNRCQKVDSSLQAVDNWYLNTLPSLLSDYRPENIYKVDETAIFFREMPDRVLESSDVTGFNRAREYVTVITCANSTGSEKMRLLVIGRSKRPRCFKGVTMDALPVQYEADLYTRLSINIFQKWVRGIDAKMKQVGRKIILFIDHCTAHTAGDLDNVKIVILPPKSPPAIQPMDQEVIRHLRQHYRKQIFTKIIGDFDGSDPQSAIDLARSITILDAAHMLNAAWKDVQPETIRKCFALAGLWKEVVNSDLPTPLPEWNPSTCIPVVGFQPFPLVNIKTEPTEEVAIAEISSVVIQHHGEPGAVCPVEEEAEEEDDDGPEIVPPTTREVWEMMRRIRNYVETREKNDFEWFYSFERRLESLSEANEIHSKITNLKQEL
ncbi:tigger transposable element-derived protein 3-like [Rhinatrema bivittatum]|uniref:tigger transposable element-derived protein 3-like n=1 Tax=Rhinatrema bivittatum TaxID=194408 RepID=UPI001129E299|nr:tigger transposable element-derived protein 3-like [Rhinatrema bivittatum]